MIIDAESGEAEIHRRVRGLGVKLGTLVYIEADGFDLRTDLADVEALLDEHRPSAVMFDSLRSLAPGLDENDSGEAEAALGSLRVLTRSRGCATLVLHHAGKANNGYRGSTAIGAAVDLGFTLAREGDDPHRRTLTCWKSRIAAEPPPRTISRQASDGRITVTAAEPARARRRDAHRRAGRPPRRDHRRARRPRVARAGRVRGRRAGVRDAKRARRRAVDDNKLAAYGRGFYGPPQGSSVRSVPVGDVDGQTVATERLRAPSDGGGTMSVERITRKSGARVYRVHWREHDRNRARAFDRRADAEAWDREVKRRQQLGVLAVQQLTDRGMTLGEWIVERWTPEHAATLEQTTRDRYANAHALHIAPALDDVPLREITVGTLRRWQAGLIARGMKPASVHKCRTFLSSVLRHAAEAEAIPANPLALVRAPRAEHRAGASARPCDRRAHPSRARRGGSRSRVRSRLRRPAARRAACTSLGRRAQTHTPDPARGRSDRQGEDDEDAIDPHRTAARASRRRSQGVADGLGSPERHRARFPGRGRRGVDEGRLGRLPCERLEDGLKRAGLVPAPRPYDLRHSFASLLLTEGRTVHYVAAKLGHSPVLTLSTYGHLIAEYAEVAQIEAGAKSE